MPLYNEAPTGGNAYVGAGMANTRPTQGWGAVVKMPVVHVPFDPATFQTPPQFQGVIGVPHPSVVLPSPPATGGPSFSRVPRINTPSPSPNVVAAPVRARIADAVRRMRTTPVIEPIKAAGIRWGAYLPAGARTAMAKRADGRINPGTR